MIPSAVPARGRSGAAGEGGGAPFFTVVTPTLNSARFLPETMRSVAAQREGGRVRVEHIVVDGGSTDGTAAIVGSFAHPDTRFVRQTLPGGPAAAIEQGLSEARGEFLSWLNSDDVLEPGAMERAAAVFARRPGAAMCFGRCRIIDASGSEIRRAVTAFKNAWFPLSCHAAIRTLNYVSQPASFFRRGARLRAGALRRDLLAAWDYDWTLRLWRQGGAAVVPGPPLASFRWTPGSISGANYRRQFAEELAVARADAGAFAPSALLHALVARGIVFCYDRMTSGPRR